MYTSSKTKTMSTTNNENDDDDSNKAPFLEIGVDVADGEAAKNVVEKAVADLQMTMNLTPSSNNNASSPFKLEHHAKGVPVYSSSAYGPSPLVKERGCLLWYSPIPVSEKAETFYEYLISAEGYQLVDPNSDPNDFDKPEHSKNGDLMRWSLISAESGLDIPQIQVEYAHMNILPGCFKNMPIPITFLGPRDYVVLNSYDRGNKTFFSFSVQASTCDIPAPTVYESEGIASPGPEKRTRMAIYVALHVTPDANDSNACTLHYFQWADILGGMPTAASSFGTGHSYAGFMERLYKKYPPSKS